ncbi:hypothetical protein ACIQ6Y_18790 [Streptomyces sp. NPDC096205]|uniref:hypothetical protein n=1 Tax=Streptomyces sp. NPDC096205 TaxID=3366081 RepID=UPI00381C822A
MIRSARADLTVYRWSERSLIGRGDVGPVTTSLEREALLRWNSRIEHLVWAAQDDTGDLSDTAPGFVYLRYGHEAALLRKVPARDPHGRSGSTLTHVLTGPADSMDLHLALAACRSDWDDWLPPRARQDALLDERGPRGPEDELLPRVPLDRVRALLLQREHLLDDLDTAALALPEELLTRLAEALMEHPGAPLTVVGSPLPGEVVVHALAELLSQVVVGDWTFATHEESDAARELPQFVFVRPDATAGLQGTRRRIDVTAPDGTDGPLRGHAALLVRLHRRRGRHALARLRPPLPLTSAEQVQHWVEQHSVAPGLLSDLTSLLEAAPHGDLSPTEAAYLHSRAALPRVRLELSRLTDGHLAALLHAWSPFKPELAPYPQVREEIRLAAVQRCFDAAAAVAARPARELEDVLRAAPPDAGQVRGVLGERLELAVRRAEVFDVVPLLSCAARIGLSRAGLDDLTEVLVGRFSTTELIREIDRISRAEPERARALLERCAERGTARGRRDAYDVLRRTEFLAEAVDRMAPQNPARAVQLYGLLLRWTIGPRLGPRAVTAVLEAAGSRPSPALLWALLDGCRRGRAHRAVVAVVVDQYFRLQLPHPADRRGPYPHDARD